MLEPPGGRRCPGGSGRSRALAPALCMAARDSGLNLRKGFLSPNKKEMVSVKQGWRLLARVTLCLRWYSDLGGEAMLILTRCFRGEGQRWLSYLSGQGRSPFPHPWSVQPRSQLSRMAGLGWQLREDQSGKQE